MKKIVLIFLASTAMQFSSYAADNTVTLKNVHLCCDECVRGVERSIKGVNGVTMKADKDAETITLESADTAALQKAADAMAAGGYFGVSDDSKFKPIPKTGAESKKVQSMIVTGVHLCCGGCVKAVDRAVKKTKGATGHTAKKHSTTFYVTGDFNDQEFFNALNEEGLSGKITDKAAPEPVSSKEKSKDH